MLVKKKLIQLHLVIKVESTKKRETVSAIAYMYPFVITATSSPLKSSVHLFEDYFVSKSQNEKIFLRTKKGNG